MRAVPASAGRCLLLAAFLALLGGWAAGESAAQQGDKGKKAGPEPSAKAEKTYQIKMEGKPWAAVFEWLSKETGLNVVRIFTPTGTFTFTSPEGKRFTLPEVVDIINEGLLANESTQRYLLIRRDRNFTLVRADEKINPDLMPKVTPKDLDSHGNTEIVSCNVSLLSMDAEAVAPKFKKLMGDFAEVLPMPGNRLVMQGTVGNIKLVLKEIEESELGNAAGSYSHICKYVQVRDAERMLRTLLGDTIVQAQTPQQDTTSPSRDRSTDRGSTDRGTRGPGRGSMGRGGSFDRGSFDRGSFDPQSFDPRSMFDRGMFDRGDWRGDVQPSGGRTETGKPFYIVTDEARNTILVTGGADVIAKATSLIEKQIDIPKPPDPPVLIGKPFFKTYRIPGGNAVALAKDLQAIYPASASLRITPDGETQIRVYGTPEDQDSISTKIDQNKEKSLKPQIIDTGSLNPKDTAEKLKDMLGDATKDSNAKGTPYIAAMEDLSGIMVRGTPEQVEEVKEIILAMQGVGSTGTGTMRVITLEKGGGSASVLAELLGEMLPQMRKNPVQVNTKPTGGGQKEKPPMDKDGKEGDKKEPKKSDGKQRSKVSGEGHSKVRGRSEEENNPRRPAVKVAQQVSARGKQAGQDQKGGQEQKPGDEGKPVRITAIGNRLIITSEDPKALQAAYELVRFITSSTNDGDFEVIQLQNANATETAKVIDEWFNGPARMQQQQQGGGGRGGRNGGGGGGFGFQGGGGGGFGGGRNGGGGGFGFQGGQPVGGAGGNQAATRPSLEDKVRIVADPQTNSLLVRASMLDMATIKKMIKEYLDVEDKDSKAILKTWSVGPLKSVAATEVADVIRNVYYEQTNQNPRPGQRGFGFAALANAQTNVGGGASRSVSLSLGVDEKNNTLHMVCTEAMYENIIKLVDKMEEDAKKSERTIQIVSVKGVDPSLVQQMLDAIQGRTPTNGNRGGFGGGGFGGGGAGGGGRGGFGGGGGGGPGGGGFGGGGAGGGGRGGFGGGGFGGGGGGGRGGFGGGGMGGGGGTRGGGGGRGGNRSDPSGGPDFFADGVKDDPQPTLYDPQLDTAETGGSYTPVGQDAAKTADGKVQPVRYEQQPQPPAGSVRPPLLPVNAVPLDQLGVIVLSGTSKADVELAMQLIEVLQKIAKEAEVEIKTVKLENADATSVSNILGQVYTRVILGAGGAGPTLSAPTTTSQQVGPFQSTSTTSRPASVALIPLPRFNSLIVAAQRGQMPGVEAQIKNLDQPTDPKMQVKLFPLKRASAQRAATAVNNFYAQRFSGGGAETPAQNQIRVTFDTSINTLFVVAAPADLAEIATLIEHLDTAESVAVNELRIFPLKTALSDDMAVLLIRVLTDGVAPYAAPAATLPGVGGVGALGGGGFGAAGGGVLGGGALGGGALGGGALGGAGALGGGGFAGGAGALGAQQATTRATISTGVQTKTTALRYVSRGTGEAVKSGQLEDIFITSDPRTNSLIVSASAASLKLVEVLVKDLDVPPAARSIIRTYRLKNADAATIATTLQQLFFGTTTGAGGGGFGGGGFGGGGFGGGAAGQVRPLTPLSLTGTTPEGVPLIDLRITVDPRTNSIIYAGSDNDILVLEAIIDRLDSPEVEQRRYEVYHLRNATAADVATALTTFITNSLNVYSTYGQATNFLGIERQVVVVAESVTNKLLISATPRYYGEIMRLIHEMDSDTPQVVVQVLIAEVDLSGSEEFGVELGLQAPVLFNRGTIPAPGFFGTGTIAYANAANPLNQILPGVSVTGSLNPTSQPGFNFNNVSLPIGNNPVVNPGVVGFQGLGNLGVGRVSPNSNVGGFVFSAASDSFNLLIRALKTQGRIDILNRSEITTTDNQTASIVVGQLYPQITSTSVTGTGIVTPSITYRSIGVQLNVTPRISPDGKVVMRVTPEVSAVSPTTSVNLGNGVTASAIDIQTLDTTVISLDGETVVLGGLIHRNDTKHENKIPWLGDLPGIGAAFRYRTQLKTKQELLVIMTPHIVRNRADAQRILCEEGKKMDWVLGDVVRYHGSANLECLFPPNPCKTGSVDGCLPPNMLPATPLPQQPAPATAPQAMPQVVPTAPPQGKTPAPGAGAASGVRQGQGPVIILNSRPAALPATASSAQPTMPAAPGMTAAPYVPAATGTWQPPNAPPVPVQPTGYNPSMAAPPAAPAPTGRMMAPGASGQPAAPVSASTWVTPGTAGQPLAPAPTYVPRQGEPNPTVTPVTVWSPSSATPTTAPGGPNDPRKESNRWQPYPDR